MINNFIIIFNNNNMNDQGDPLASYKFPDFNSILVKKFQSKNKSTIGVLCTSKAYKWGILTFRLIENISAYLSAVVNINWMCIITTNQQVDAVIGIFQASAAKNLPIPFYYGAGGRKIIKLNDFMQTGEVPQYYLNQYGQLQFITHSAIYMMNNFGKYMNNIQKNGSAQIVSGAMILLNNNMIINTIRCSGEKEVLEIKFNSKQKIKQFFNDWEGKIGRNYLLIQGYCNANNIQSKKTLNVLEFFCYPQITPEQQLKVAFQFQKFLLSNSSMKMIETKGEVRQVQNRLYGQHKIPKYVRSPNFVQTMQSILRQLPKQLQNNNTYKDPLLAITKVSSGLLNSFVILYMAYTKQLNTISDDKSKIQHKFSLLEFSRLMSILALQNTKLNRTRNVSDAKSLLDALMQLQNQTKTAFQNSGKHFASLSTINQDKLLRGITACKNGLSVLINLSPNRPIPRPNNKRKQEKANFDDTFKANKQMQQVQNQLVAMNKMVQREATVNLSMNDKKINIMQIRINDVVDTNQNPDNFTTLGKKIPFVIQQLNSMPIVSQSSLNQRQNQGYNQQMIEGPQQQLMIQGQGKPLMIQGPIRPLMIQGQPQLLMIQGVPQPLMIQGEKPLLMIQAQKPQIQRQLYPKQHTNQIIIKTLPQETKPALNSLRIKNTLQLATLLLIEKRVVRLEQICKRLSYYNQKLRQGMIFEPQQCFVSLQSNTTLAVTLAKNMELQIEICEKKITPNKSNKTRIKLLRQRLKFATSPALRISITSLVTQNQTDISLAIANTLKNDLVVADIQQLDLDTKILLQIFLQSQGQMTDFQKGEIIDSFRFSENPMKDIMQKYQDTLAKHNSALMSLAQEINLRKKQYLAQMNNQDNNQQYKNSLLKKNELQNLQREIKQIRQQKGQRNLGIVQQVQEIIVNQKPPTPSQKQAAAAAKLISQAHQNLLGVGKSDYMLNAQIGMGLSMQQINNIQNNTYFSNFSTVQGYYNYWPGLQFIAEQNFSIANMQIFTTNAILQQTAQIQSNQQRLQQGIAYVQYQNQVIYNEVQQVNQNVLQVGHIVNRQINNLQDRIQEMIRHGNGGIGLDAYKQKLNLIYTNQQQITFQLSRLQGPAQRMRMMDSIMKSFSQQAQQVAQSRKQMHEQMMKIQAGLSHNQSVTIAGNVQLCNLLQKNYNDLTAMGFSMQELQNLGYQIAENSNMINDRIQTLIINHQQSSGQAKTAYLQMLQGLAMNIQMVTQLCSSNDQIYQGQSQMMSTLMVCSDRILESLKGSSAQIIRQIGDLIQKSFQRNRHEIIQALEQSNTFVNGLFKVINNRLDINDSEISGLKTGINRFYQDSRAAFAYLHEGQSQIYNKLIQVGNTVYEGMGSIYWQGNETANNIFEIQKTLQQARQFAYQAEDTFHQRIDELKQQVGKFRADLTLKDKQIKNKTQQANFFKAKLLAVLQKLDGADFGGQLSQEQILQRVKKLFQKQDKITQQQKKIRQQISQIYGVLGIDQKLPYEQKFNSISKAINQLRQQNIQSKIDFVKKQADLASSKNQKNLLQKNMKQMEEKKQYIQKQQKKLANQVGNLKIQLVKSQAKQQGLAQIKKMGEQNMRQLFKYAQMQAQKTEKNFKQGNQQRGQLLKMIQRTNLGVQQQSARYQQQYNQLIKQHQKEMQKLVKQHNQKMRQTEKKIGDEAEEKKNKMIAQKQQIVNKFQKSVKNQGQLKSKLAGQQQMVKSLQQKNESLKQQIQKLQNDIIDPKTKKRWQVIAQTATNELKTLQKKIQEQEASLKQQLQFKQQIIKQKEQINSRHNEQIKKMMNQNVKAKQQNLAQKIAAANLLNEERLKNVQQKLENAEKKIQDSESIIKNHVKTVAQLQKKVSNAQFQERKAKKQIQFAVQSAQMRFTAEKQKLNSIISKTNQQVAEKSSEIGSLKSQISALEQAIKKQKKQMEQANSSIKTMKQEKINDSKVISELSSFSENAKQQIKKKTIQLNKLIQAKKGLEKQVFDLKQSAKKLNQQIQKMGSMIAKLEGEIKQQKQAGLKKDTQIKTYEQRQKLSRTSYFNVIKQIHKILIDEGLSPQDANITLQLVEKDMSKIAPMTLRQIAVIAKKIKQYKTKKKELQDQMKKDKEIIQDLKKVKTIKQKLEQDLEQRQRQKLQYQNQLKDIKQKMIARSKQLDTAKKQIARILNQLQAKTQIIRTQQEQLNTLKLGKMKTQDLLAKAQSTIKAKQQQKQYHKTQLQKAADQAKNLQQKLVKMQRQLAQKKQDRLEKAMLQNQIEDMKQQLQNYQKILEQGKVDVKRIDEIQRLNKQYMEQLKILKSQSKTKNQIIQQYQNMISYFDTKIKQKSDELNTFFLSGRYDQSQRTVVDAYVTQIRQMKNRLELLSREWQRLRDQNIQRLNAVKGQPADHEPTASDSFIIKKDNQMQQDQEVTQNAFMSGIINLLGGTGSKGQKSDKMDNQKQKKSSDNVQQKNKPGQIQFSGTDLGSPQRVGQFLIYIFQQMLDSIAYMLEVVSNAQEITNMYLQAQKDFKDDVFRANIISTMIKLMKQLQRQIQIIIGKLTKPFKGMNGSLPGNTHLKINDLFQALNKHFVKAGVGKQILNQYLNK